MSKKANDGFSLIGALLLIAVASVVIGVIAERSGTLAKSARKTQSKVDLAAMKSGFFQNVNCPATFDPSDGFSPQGNPCPSGKYINIRSKTGILVNLDGSTRISDWNVMAYCSAVGLDIRAVSLLPAFTGNIDDKKWAGKSTPNDLPHYRKDELSGLPYSWNHPAVQISKPGAAGLCAHWFGSAPPGACGGYLKNANINGESQACEPPPSCNPPQILVFQASSNKYICSSSFSSYVLNEFDKDITKKLNEVVDSTINTVKEELVPGINSSNDYFTKFPQFGDFKQIIHNTDEACSTQSLMTCPKGYAMWSYEARMPKDGKNCRTRCVRVVPYY